MSTTQTLKTPAYMEGNPRLVKVFMYHRIVKDAALSRASWLCVHRDAFRRQLAFLDRRGYTSITFEDYRLYREGALNLPKKPVILTFDDGYLDTYQVAFPLLYEFGMKATVFVIGERRIRSNVWDRDMPGVLSAPLMDAHHIVDLHETGFEIGAHAMTHADLTRLSEYEAWKEIVQAKCRLEELINAPVRSFAYPYGLVNPSIKHMVEQAGYEAAYSVGSGPPAFGEDPYEIRRIIVKNTTGLTAFRMKVMPRFHVYEWMRWQARRAYYALGGKPRRRISAPLENALVSSTTVDP